MGDGWRRLRWAMGMGMAMGMRDDDGDGELIDGDDDGTMGRWG